MDNKQISNFSNSISNYIPCHLARRDDHYLATDWIYRSEHYALFLFGNDRHHNILTAFELSIAQTEIPIPGIGWSSVYNIWTFDDYLEYSSSYAIFVVPAVD